MFSNTLRKLGLFINLTSFEMVSDRPQNLRNNQAIDFLSQIFLECVRSTVQEIP
jgi:hypothetical protein